MSYPRINVLRAALTIHHLRRPPIFASTPMAAEREKNSGLQVIGQPGGTEGMTHAPSGDARAGLWFGFAYDAGVEDQCCGCTRMV
ncbi:hypothetical protein ES332_D10G118900v1 [Gossypium tomentosum]|uniref:Uncharacterized protein n=1 Tax=Gossypium tomentosum TaxID=34277 RepID=A0A5D2J4J6_GOSTO|nr:hypothetical protein ES332_D10G118900v1 [Gossypium tomentosum]